MNEIHKHKWNKVKASKRGMGISSEVYEIPKDAVIHDFRKKTFAHHTFVVTQENDTAYTASGSGPKMKEGEFIVMSTSVSDEYNLYQIESIDEYSFPTDSFSADLRYVATKIGSSRLTNLHTDE